MESKQIKDLNKHLNDLTSGMNGAFSGLEKLLKKEVSKLTPEQAREAQAMMDKMGVRDKIREIKSDIAKLKKFK